MTQEQEAEVMLRIAEILENPSITKIGQNAIFDAAFLLRKYGIKTKNIQDTMIATGILTPDFQKAWTLLQVSTQKEPYYKDEGKKWFKIVALTNSSGCTMQRLCCLYGSISFIVQRAI
jgi:DNA polymerase I-like protein with 3'-5' exonuclease and polymerase domains